MKINTFAEDVVIMNVDKVTKTITARCTEIWSPCPARFCLTATDVSKVKYESEAMRFGTDVHAAICYRLTGQPANFTMSAEVVQLLCNTEVKFDGYDMSRAQIEIKPSDLLGKDVIFTSGAERVHISFTGLETWQQVLAKIMTCKAVQVITGNEYGATLQSSVRGAGSFLSVTAPYTNSKSCLFTLISRDMFGKELVHFEKPVTFCYMCNGWTIIINGTVDAMSADGDLIVDWKTTAQTPSDEVDFKYLGYYIQQCIYKTIINKMLGTTTPGYVVLAYIVKTKIPKFKPFVFKVSDANLRAVDELIQRQLGELVNYLNTGVMPRMVYGDHCNWCPVKSTCPGIAGITPETVGISKLLYENMLQQP